MNPEIMGRRDGNGNGIRGLQVRVQPDRADLDHFKDQFVADLAVGAALVGDRLVPFQIKDDIGHRFPPKKVK